jgi:hypothetical protein
MLPTSEAEAEAGDHQWQSIVFLVSDAQFLTLATQIRIAHHTIKLAILLHFVHIKNSINLVFNEKEQWYCCCD